MLLQQIWASFFYSIIQSIQKLKKQTKEE